jgi:polyphenol oxidase
VDEMIPKNTAGIERLEFEIFNDYPCISHFITTRHGGESKEKYASLNFSYHVGDDPVSVSRNRSKLTTETGIDENRLFFPDQCHTDQFKIIDKNEDAYDLSQTDALITNLPGNLICIATADCVPLLIYAPGQKIVAAVHAGWRGLVSLLPQKTVQKIKETFNAEASDMIAGIGPCISAEVYEVGEDVISAVEKTGWKNSLVYMQKGKALLNLREMTKLQLIASGLQEKNIEISDICTFRSPDFFSARRDGFATGRFATGIIIR